MADQDIRAALDRHWAASAAGYQDTGKPAFTVSIMEFRDDKVVHETQYFADPFDAPAWRKVWVEPMAAA